MKRFVAIALIMMMALPVIVSCNSSSATTASAGDVQVATAIRGDIKQEITPSGNLVMPNVAKLNFGSAGTVIEVNVEIGDAVKKGQVLAKLDTLALEQALIKAKIDYRTSQMTLEKAQASVKSSSSSSAGTDPLDIEAKTLDVERTRLALNSAQNDLDSATIKATFDGLIGQVAVAVGDTVAANTLAIRLVDPTKIQVNAYVNEMDVFQVKMGAAATVGIDALTTSRLPATVFAIAPSADATGGVVNYLVKLSVKVPSDFTMAASNNGTSAIGTPVTFKEGLTVSVTITIDEKKGVIIIPNRGVTRQGGNSVVQVVKADGTLEQRVVQTGLSTAQNVEITSGLSEGEKIAIFKSTTAPTSQQIRIPRL